MTLQNLSVLAINSLPANGNAGLKMVMSVLGTLTIPVPSIVLSGIGNMRHLEGFTIDHLKFKELLEGSIQIAHQRNTKLILYVGYLGSQEQISIIRDLIEKHSNDILYTFIDPVSGDHGKAYVDQKIIDQWPLLLEKANFAIPNLTEVAILSGHQENFKKEKREEYLKAFQEKFPQLSFIATSLSTGQELINRLHHAGKTINFHHFLYPGNYSGAGDTFASLFLLFHFFKGYSLAQSTQKAGDAMAHLIRQSIQTNSEDLMIRHSFLLKKEDYFDL